MSLALVKRRADRQWGPRSRDGADQFTQIDFTQKRGSSATDPSEESENIYIYIYIEKNKKNYTAIEIQDGEGLLAVPSPLAMKWDHILPDTDATR
jgi:hypothetical protein